MGYEHRGDGVGGGGSGQWQTHANRVHRDTKGEWSLGQRSDAILTHVSVARPLTKLIGYVPLENAVWG